MEHVVAEHQCDVVTADELPADDKCLGEAVGMLLHSVLKAHPQLGAVPQEFLEVGGVLRRRDDEHLADAGQHEHA